MPQGGSTIAEGIAVGTPGRLTRAIIERHVDDLVLVDEGDIEQAIVMLLEIEKTLVEGAGAAGLAALLRHPRALPGRKVGLVLGGGNIDPLLLAAIIERGMVRAGRLARVRVSARDVPGSLAHITATRQRSGRQHRRSPPPARLHHAGGAERRDRTGDPDPRGASIWRPCWPPCAAAASRPTSSDENGSASPSEFAVRSPEKAASHPAGGIGAASPLASGRHDRTRNPRLPTDKASSCCKARWDLSSTAWPTT